MPCTITGSLEGDAALFAKESLDKCRIRAQKLNRLLCMLCRDVENRAEHPLPSQVAKWWKRHKEIDLRRDLKKRVEGLERKARRDATPDNVPYCGE